MPLAVPNLNPVRLRSYVLRLPLCTRIVLLIIVALSVATTISPALRQKTALIPDQVSITAAFRLNTFPVTHVGIIHTLFNLLAITPLLERFEAEHGTLVSLALFSGPFATLPGIIYIIIERGILRGNTPVQGASVWVFLLLAAEAMKTHRANPFFSLGPYKIPTWTTPLIFILLTSFLVPNTSLVGHLCGALIGYLWGLNYIKFLAPPEKILRWIENKLNLLVRLPHYVSVDRSTFGRYGVLPSTTPLATLPTGVAAP
ncbi:rhomboid protein 2 [Diplodia corticola]|uniref:rhomboid protease n=1 Tax=Diplodia corticola TaxID=236234 RepID=A0A1J9RBY3_9PEZI|nr:rhomboid protein 2 [Diplodia corticola]OJD38072.1 rhomboid protein 2 [Diplodia corticola]